MIRDTEDYIVGGRSDTSSRFAGVRRLALAFTRRDVLLGTAAFVLKRLFLGALVLVAITYLTYLGLSMAQGTEFRPAVVQAGGDTLTYVSRLARGDLGRAVSGSITLRAIPVMEVVPDRVAKSFGLLAVALVFAAVVGVALGLWAAGRRHSRSSLLPVMASIVGVSIPSFFAALLLQLLVIRLTRMAGHTVLPVGGFGWDSHIILPALVLAARPIAQIARITYVSIGEVLDQEYVRVAHGKGLSSRRVMLRHVIRNAAIPILTTIGLSLRFSLSSLPVVEYFFGWPGVGFTLLKAISLQDANLTLAMLLSLGALFVVVNVVLEASYRLIDPRLRESPDHTDTEAQNRLTERIAAVVTDVRTIVADRLDRIRSRGEREPAPNPFRSVLDRRDREEATTVDYRRRGALRIWVRSIFGNLPFILGTLLVVGLIAVVLFGPHIAPHSPYTTRGLGYHDGEFKVPPFAPDEIYPMGTDVLGRDVMSLILVGAQQTLRLAVLVVAVRLVLGFVLGAIAGWVPGSWFDRLLLGAVETIAAFPTLLLAMLFVLALGIRQGFLPFIVALSLVGWIEVMQFVRAEVMTIRPEPYIESAVATGLRTPRIVLGHVLPNLVPSLISLAALEMGAVLMLLGELGFIGIFIGGGAFAELPLGAVYHYSDVPEWGAMLSNVRNYARPYPWTAVYPALAFFITIVGFNLFGEGTRRLVEDLGARLGLVLNRKTLAIVVILVAAFGWIRGQSGALAIYQRQADAFDGQQALSYVERLADPTFEGRALGTEGMDRAATYIAEEFEALGLQAAGEDLTYFQTRPRQYQSVDAVPQLRIDDGGPALRYRQEYAEFPEFVRNLGEVEGEVRFVAFGELTDESAGFGRRTFPALEDLDYSDEIVLVPSEEEVRYLRSVPRGGVLVVADDEADLARRHTLSPRDPNLSFFGTGRDEVPDVPVLWIDRTTADRLLKGTGYSFDELRRVSDNLGRDELIGLQTGTRAAMSVQGTVHDKVPVRHVIGHMPGVAGQGASKLDDNMIVVLAQYDSPPHGPTDAVYPAANDNASGVAVMLEAIRTMQETGYQPYKTFLFVAYTGEGFEGWRPVSPPEVERFLQAKRGFSTAFNVEAVVDLRGLGAGSGDSLQLATSGSLRLANLFVDAADRMGVDASRRKDPVDISVVFEDGNRTQGGEDAPRIGLSWEGWETTSRLPADTPDTVSATTLEQSGRALGLGLMVLGRETQY